MHHETEPSTAAESAQETPELLGPYEDPAHAEPAQSDTPPGAATVADIIASPPRSGDRYRRFASSTAFKITLASLSVALIVAVPRIREYLHRGITFRASSALPGYPTSGPLDKTGPYGLIFHTKTERQPWVIVDLGREREIREIDIVNRTDCCKDRASHLAVEIGKDGKSFSRVAERQSAFDTWQVSVPEGTRTRYIRIMSLQRTMLHLARITVD